jgi:hypothetical protein
MTDPPLNHYSETRERGVQGIAHQGRFNEDNVNVLTNVESGEMDRMEGRRAAL